LLKRIRNGAGTLSAGRANMRGQTPKLTFKRHATLTASGGKAD